jgi:hypothetical protein
MAVAAIMLAHQVAGKAVRDSFFLSNYPTSDLPKIVIAAAAATVLFVLLFARAMGHLGPQRLVPAGFLISSMLHIAEYRVMAGNPALWSVLIYVHIVALGAILISGFWSLMAETYHPRSAKQIFGRIAGAGTLGGIAGGLMAERIAAMFSASSVLLFLAACHLLCAGVLLSLQSSASGPPRTESRESIRPLELFRRAPYLGVIAVLVLAGTTQAAILDYLFKAGAGATFAKGAPLLRFFAVFYTVTQVLTLFAQMFLARPSLQRFGIGHTILALPVAVGAGTLGALFAPIFPVFALFRSMEVGLRGSMFRAGYELLYTPVPEAEKRATKTFLDVGCDRAGDALGSGIVQLMLWFGAVFIPSGLLGAMLALAAAGIWAALRLDPAYSELVQQRLVDRAVELELDDIDDSTTRGAIAHARVSSLPSPVPTSDFIPFPEPGLDPLLDVMKELRSADRRRVLAALKETSPPKPIIASQLVLLLAWDEVSDAIRESLQKAVGFITGLLIDHLTDPGVEFASRRRIPRILAQSDSPFAIQGLIAGLSDVRFEVRFQCSRALDSLLQRRSDLKVPADVVFAAVERELRVARPIRESRRLLDARDSSDPNTFLDEILRERADETLEHIFSLFASVLPREPIKIAFRSLHTDDSSLRGLATEYLDSVLPTEIRAALWEMIEIKAEREPSDAREDPLSELLRAHDSLLLLMSRGKFRGHRPSDGME